MLAISAVVLAASALVLYGQTVWSPRLNYQGNDPRRKANAIAELIIAQCVAKVCIEPDIAINRTTQPIWVVENRQGMFELSNAKTGTKVAGQSAVWSCMDNSRFAVLCGR